MCLWGRFEVEIIHIDLRRDIDERLWRRCEIRSLLAGMRGVNRHLSRKDFQHLADAAVTCKAFLPQEHRTKHLHFWDEMTQCASDHWEDQVVRLIQQSPVLSVSWDEKDGSLVITVRILNSDYEPSEHFHKLVWADRGDHRALFELIIGTFTKRDISKQSLFMKWTSGSTDGCSVNGVQSPGRMMEHAFGEKNVWKLVTEEKKHYSNEGIFLQWCGPPAYDLVTDSILEVPFFRTLSEWVSFVTCHVMHSPKAQATLKWFWCHLTEKH